MVAVCLVEFTDLLTVRGKTAPIRWPMKPATSSKFNGRRDDALKQHKVLYRVETALRNHCMCCECKDRSAVAPDRTVHRVLCRAGLTCKLAVHSPEAVMTAAIEIMYVTCRELVQRACMCKICFRIKWTGFGISVLILCARLD